MSLTNFINFELIDKGNYLVECKDLHLYMKSHNSFLNKQ